MLEKIIKTANKIHQLKYPQAKAIFLAGSVIRGEATSTSDLDLVVIFEKLPNAYRDSYFYNNWPVEAFVHTPQTLEYFFHHVDKPTGIPSLPAMVSEGIEIPGANDYTKTLKNMANETLQQGPPEWSKQDIDRSRYMITDLIEDLTDSRSTQELQATAIRLYPALANHYFRSNNNWSANGKAIPRALHKLDACFAQEFIDSFEHIFCTNKTDKVINLCREILENNGGFLFEGYRLDAPKSWRTESSDSDNS